MNNERRIKRLIMELESVGISFEKGLSNKEMESIEDLYEIKFPKDWREFIQIKIPSGNGFVDWKLSLKDQEKRKEIKQRLSWPMDGLLHSVKGGYYWSETWGEKPMTFEEQKKRVITAFKNYPKLIPIYSHRYIPMDPNDHGNPVFSVHQADTIYYGMDLTNYFEREFDIELPSDFGEINSPKRIVFWSDLVDENNRII